MPESLLRCAAAVRPARAVSCVRSSSFAPVLLLLALLAAACDDGDGGTTSEDRLSVTLYTDQSIGLPNTAARIEALRISIVERDSAEVIGGGLIPIEDNRVGRVPDLPFGENLELHVEALDSRDRTVAYGGSMPFDVRRDQPDAPRFVLFVSENDSTAPLSAIFSDNVVQASPFVAGDGRAGHTATPLPDGRVLLVGGAVLTAPGAGVGGSHIRSVHASVEIYDPRTGYFDPALDARGNPLSLAVPRTGHEALVLPSGAILIIGGLTQDSGEPAIVSTRAVELITPLPDGRFTIAETASLNTPRAGAASVVRDKNSIIVTGGYNRTRGGTDVALDTAELFDISANVFLNLPGTMSTPRYHHTAALVGAAVFIAGGTDGTQALADVEIFNTQNQTWVPLAPMAEPRHSHAMLRLSMQNGRYLLIAGGHPEASVASVPHHSYEIFDTVRGTWATPTEATGMNNPRASFELVELRDGAVLAIGGLGLLPGTADTLVSISAVERLEPPASGAGVGNFGPLFQAVDTDPLQLGRFDTASVVLPNGMVVITGGARFEQGGFASFPLSDIYNPGPPPVLSLR